MPFTCTAPAVPTVQQDDATVHITRWDFTPGTATALRTTRTP
jgi:beta-alanine degradation protein BauB